MTQVRITDQEASDCIQRLWKDAFEKSAFETICTLLRVSGLQDAGWDPFEESEQAFEDFNWHLKAESDDLSDKSPWRMGLLIYCQAVEMSAVHSILANLLRILLGQPYHLNPLGSLGRADKKRMFKWYPPSAKVKWRKIRNMAMEAGRADLVRMIDAVYDDAVRNAFSHSDYIITDTHFRWTEGSLGEQMPLQQVDNLISNSFTFFSIFMGIRDWWLSFVGAMPRYHKWPHYEVFEILKDGGGRCNGFRVHFSNGCDAHFLRTPEGVDLMNVTIEGAGTLGLMVGPLNARQRVWMVEGHPVDFGDQDAANEF